MRLRTGIPMLGFVSAILLLSGPGAWAEAVSVNPPMVVVDSTDAPVGAVVGIDSDGRAQVLLPDPDPIDNPRGIFLTVRRSELTTADQSDVLYANPDCLGNAYLWPAAFESIYSVVTRANYAVGPNDTGDSVVYRAFGDGAHTPYNSYWDGATRQCTNASGNASLNSATEIINLSQEYPPPYRARFPGLD